LLEQSVTPREIIIVDQSSDKQSIHAVEQEFQKAAETRSNLPKLNYIHDSSIQGLSAARNVGNAVAEQPIWLSLDDDVLMEEDFLKELMRAYEGPKPTDGASGIITNYLKPSLTLRLWLSIFALSPFVDPRQPVYWNVAEFPRDAMIEVPVLTGALMSFRSERVRSIPFDVRASDCQCEDYDYCVLLGEKRRLVIVVGARLKHMVSPKGREASHWIRRFALSYAFLFRKHYFARRIDHVRFGWLCIGLGLIATVAGLRRFSLEPWRTYVSSVQEGMAAARESLSLPMEMRGQRTNTEMADPGFRRPDASPKSFLI
jgi:GT2 family glycosyltransferase